MRRGNTHKSCTCECAHWKVRTQTCMMKILSLTSFFDFCVCSWEVYAKVFSGATVSLWERRGGTQVEGEREERREKEGEKPHLTSFHTAFAICQLLRGEQERPWSPNTFLWSLKLILSALMLTSHTEQTEPVRLLPNLTNNINHYMTNQLLYKCLWGSISI